MSVDSIVWLVVLIGLLCLEAATTTLVSIWFAAGAAVTLVLSLFAHNLWLQLFVFAAASFAALLLTRPLVQRIRQKRPEPTNGDRNLGRTAVVLETITPATPGRVRLDGVDWRACSRGQTLQPGTRCRVCDIQSTVLIVEPQPEHAAL